MRSYRKRRLLSGILTVCLIFSQGITPVSAYAAPDEGKPVCTHHTHDETCGYSEGTPCGHEHTEDCYTLVTECIHEHTAECYPQEEGGDISGNKATPSDAKEKEPSECSHECSEETGCITRELDCQHEHDSECGYTEGTDCTFNPADCEICNPKDSGEADNETGTGVQEQCSCIILCTEDNTNPDCPVCGIEGADLVLCEGIEEIKCSCDTLCTEDSINLDCPVCGAEDADLVLCKGIEEIKCTCDTLCTEDSINLDCPVCGAEDAGLEACKGKPLLAVNASVGDVVLNSSPKFVRLTAEDCGDDCQGHRITQTGGGKNTSSMILVESGAHNVTFVDLNLTTAYVGILSGGTMNLTVEGSNTISAALNKAGISVPEGAALTITAESTGSLTVSGNVRGAGIGGAQYSADIENEEKQNGNCGTIIINGGNIKATGGTESAGIGGAWTDDGDGKGGIVTINGGYVTAIGGDNVYDIGGGMTTDEWGNWIVGEAGSLTLTSADVLNADTSLGQGGTYTINGDPVGDMIVVPEGLFYTGEVLATSSDFWIDDTKTGTAEYFGQTFIVNSSADGWELSRISPSEVKDAGIYTVVFAKNGKEIENTFAVFQSGSEFPKNSVKTYLGDQEQDTFTYGDIITVKVQAPRPTGALPMAFVAPDSNQMAVYNEDGKQISEAVDAVDGVYTMTINTADKEVAIKENTLTAKYVASSNMAAAAVDFSITLQPKPLTAVIDYSREYDGKADFTVVASLLDILDQDWGRLQAEVYGTVESANVGKYTFKPEQITFNGGPKEYYSLEASGIISATVTITPKTVSSPIIALDGDSFEYTGSAIEPRVTVKDGDTVIDPEEYEVVYSNNEDAGTSATVTVNDVDGGNYTISSTTATFTITPFDFSTATVTLSQNSYTYNGTPQYPGLADITVVKNGVTIEASGNYTVSFTNGQGGVARPTAADTYTVTINQIGLNCTGKNDTATFEIKQAPLTPSLTGDTTKVYDGTTAAPNGLAISLEGKVEDDDVAAIADFAYDSPDAGDGKTITATNIQLTGTDAKNYELRETEVSIEGHITKAAAPTITWPAASSLTYGQKLSASTLSGGSREYGDFAWAQPETVPEAGSGSYTVTFSPNEATRKNYQEITDKNQEVSIVVAQASTSIELAVSVSDDNGMRKAEIRATASRAANGKAPSGNLVLTGDGLNVTLDLKDGTADYIWSGLAKQEYTVTAAYGGDGNYSAAEKKITFDTSKQEQEEFSVSDPGTKTYGDAAFELSVSGGSGAGAVTFESSDPAIVSISGDTASIHRAGTVTITAVKAGDDQYNEAFASIPLFVERKEIVFKAKDEKITVGDSMPAFAYEPVALVGDDRIEVKPVASCNAVDTNTPGEYTITFSGAVLTNQESYTIRYEPGTLTIAQKSSGGGSSSGGSSNNSSSDNNTVITPPAAPDSPTTGETAPTKPDGNGNVSIQDSAVDTAISAAKQEAARNGKDKNGIAVTVPVEIAQGQQTVNITLREETLDTLVRDGVKRFTIKTDDMISVSLDEQTLKALDSQTSGDIILKVERTTVSAQSLSKEAETAIGARPVYDISFWYIKDGNKTPITAINGNAVSIAIPYTPAADENTGGLYAVYVADDGKVEWLTKSSYDADQKAVIFEAQHFSIYGVGYKNPMPAFTDINGHWAEEHILFTVSRSLFSGTGETTFSPDAPLTRGMFVTALGRLAGIDPADYQTGIFTDVQADAYYFPYVNWAAKAGIVAGTTETTFAPDSNITREQMAVIMKNYADRTGYSIPKTLEAVTFADNANISSWAKDAVKIMQQAGVLSGKGDNRFDPKGNATRAEAAAVLHRFVEVIIDPQTANGWTQNDNGEWYYNKNGEPVKGWLSDDQKWYWLDSTGKMFAGGWKQIGGKWYYFYADGSMAVNTTVDGYSVDADGVREG